MKINYLKDLSILLNTLEKIIDSCKANGDNNYAKAIAIKTHLHVKSVFELTKGYSKVESEGLKTIDFSSMIVLTRAAMESFLTFNQVFISANSDDEKQFRFLSWDLAGLIERRNFPAESKENIEIKKEEQQLIEVKTELLKKNSFFISLSPKNQDKVTNGNWRYSKYWSDLAKEAGFNITFFKNAYKYMCSYSHSGRLSALQIMQALNEEDQRLLTTSSLGYCNIILSNFIFDFIKLFPDTETLVQQNSKPEVVARVWKSMGKMEHSKESE